MNYDDAPYGSGTGYSASPAPQENHGHAKIKIIGVGGGGNNSINRMIEAGVTEVDFIAVNTDQQILGCNRAPTRIQIGAEKTRGLGAGADPKVGEQAAEESKDALKEAIGNADLLFIVAGMGGGTGTGAAPVVARLAKEKAKEEGRNILVVAVVTKPFVLEGTQRMKHALEGIQALRKYVDAVITVPNEKVLSIARMQSAPVQEAFRIADDVLLQCVCGITNIIVTPGEVNLDFADICTVLQNKGVAHMGVGRAEGENRIVVAVQNAVASDLLETTIEGAKHILVNVTGGNDVTMEEFQQVMTMVQGVVDPGANIIVGLCTLKDVHGEVEVTIIASGFAPADDMHPSPEVPSGSPRGGASIYPRGGAQGGYPPVGGQGQSFYSAPVPPMYPAAPAQSGYAPVPPTQQSGYAPVPPAQQPVYPPVSPVPPAQQGGYAPVPPAQQPVYPPVSPVPPVPPAPSAQGDPTQPEDPPEDPTDPPQGGKGGKLPAWMRFLHKK